MLKVHVQNFGSHGGSLVTLGLSESNVSGSYLEN